MSEIPDDIKRIKVFEKLFVWLGKDKITLKDLEDSTQHLTMLVNNEGIFDIHKTKEGSAKEYESLAKVDFKKILGNNKDPDEVQKKFLEDIMPQIIPISFDEQEFSDCVVFLRDSIGDFLKDGVKEKRTLVYSTENINESEFSKLFIPWNQAKGKVKGQAFVMKDGETMGLIFEVNDECYYMPMDAIFKTELGTMLKSIVEQANNYTERKA